MSNNVFATAPQETQYTFFLEAHKLFSFVTFVMQRYY